MLNKLAYLYLLWSMTAAGTQTYTMHHDTIEYQMSAHGIVTEKLTEGCEQDLDDTYTVTLLNGTLIDITADDLLPGDDVTVYYLDGEIVRVLYGHR